MARKTNFSDPDFAMCAEIRLFWSPLRLGQGGPTACSLPPSSFVVQLGSGWLSPCDLQGLTQLKTPSRNAVELGHLYRNEFRVRFIRFSDTSTEESRDAMTGRKPYCQYANPYLVEAPLVCQGPLEASGLSDPECCRCRCLSSLGLSLIPEIRKRRHMTNWDRCEPRFTTLSPDLCIPPSGT